MKSKNTIALTTLLIAALFSFGCSGMSKKDCASTDWKEQGIKDGKKGQAATDILKTEKICNTKNTDFPIVAYKEGWLVGIEEYCSPENGFELSSKGKKVKVENCPIEFQPKLVESIKKGEEYLKVNKNIAKLEKTEEKMKEKREEAKEDINKAQNKIEKLKAEKEELLTPESN